MPGFFVAWILAEVPRGTAGAKSENLLALGCSAGLSNLFHLGAVKPRWISGSCELFGFLQQSRQAASASAASRRLVPVRAISFTTASKLIVIPLVDFLSEPIVSSLAGSPSSPEVLASPVARVAMDKAWFR